MSKIAKKWNIKQYVISNINKIYKNFSLSLKYLNTPLIKQGLIMPYLYCIIQIALLKVLFLSLLMCLLCVVLVEVTIDGTDPCLSQQFYQTQSTEFFIMYFHLFLPYIQILHLVVYFKITLHCQYLSLTFTFVI